MTRDITAFKEKQIAGKTLRLDEGDVEGYVFFFSLALLFSFLFLYLSRANNWTESKV